MLFRSLSRRSRTARARGAPPRRPGLTRPPRPTGGDAPGTTAPAAAAGATDALEENATSRRARAPDRGTRKPGRRAPQRAGDAAAESAHTAAAAPTRRGDAPPLALPTRRRDAPRGFSLAFSPPSRFPHRSPPPPACCSRPAPAGPRTDAGTSASRNAHGPLRLAGPLGRHTAGFGRKSPFVRRGERRPTSDAGTRPKPPPPPLSPRARQRLTCDGKRAGEEAAPA